MVRAHLNRHSLSRPRTRACSAWWGLAATRLFGVLAVLGYAITLGLGGCLEADSRGGEPPDEVAVGTPPAWANGIGELMELKCAVCHRVPLPDIAPSGTPTNFDLSVQFQRADGVNGAADVLLPVQTQVGGGFMPLEYATPLTDAERQAILNWDGS